MARIDEASTYYVPVVACQPAVGQITKFIGQNWSSSDTWTESAHVCLCSVIPSTFRPVIRALYSMGGGLPIHKWYMYLSHNVH